MDSIFGTGQRQQRGTAQARTENSSDVAVKAGIMTVEDKKVKPDKRKGMIKILDGGDMDAARFQWIDVDNNNHVEEEWYLLADDAEFKKVGQAKGRIYVLNMKSWDSQKYFWFQEPDKEKDEEFCQKINEAIKIKSSSGAAAGGDADMFGDAGNIPGFGQNSGQPGTGNQQDMLRQLLAGMQNLQQNKGNETPGLSSVITNEAVEKMIADPTYFAELKEHLPEGYQTEEGFKESIRSPQFRQALDALTSAVNSEQITAVITSLGLDTTVLGQSTDGVDALVRALEKESEGQRKSNEDSKPEGGEAEKKEE
mmetsp:Transcript_35089/g.39819  ORF Transcript_35089/g.39819 Transcript_35089/m.39819 type:complete len:310 (+) Transcript_35089:39-968(+)